MIKVYKDWVIVFEDNQYKVGTMQERTNPKTQEKEQFLVVDGYFNTITSCIKNVMQIEQRRLASRNEAMELEEYLIEFKNLQSQFEDLLKEILEDM